MEIRGLLVLVLCLARSSWLGHHLLIKNDNNVMLTNIMTILIYPMLNPNAIVHVSNAYAKSSLIVVFGVPPVDFSKSVTISVASRKLSQINFSGRKTVWLWAYD